MPEQFDIYNVQDSDTVESACNALRVKFVWRYVSERLADMSDLRDKCAQFSFASVSVHRSKRQTI